MNGIIESLEALRLVAVAGVLLLCAACVSAAADPAGPESAKTEASGPYGAASLYFDPEVQRQVHAVLTGSLLADKETQARKLASVLTQQFRGRPGVKALELEVGQRIGVDQTKAAIQFLADTQGIADSGRHSYVLRFLCCAYSVVEGDAAKAAVLEALDSEFGRVLGASTNLMDIRDRVGRWGELTDAIDYFGCRELFTEAFWKALQANDFRYGIILAMHGDKDTLNRLRKIREELKPGNDEKTQRLGEIISNLELALEYPALRQVTAKFFRSDLEDLPQVSVRNRQKWVAARVEMRRQQIEAEKARLGTDTPPAVGGRRAAIFHSPDPNAGPGVLSCHGPAAPLYCVASSPPRGSSRTGFSRFRAGQQHGRSRAAVQACLAAWPA